MHPTIEIAGWHVAAWGLLNAIACVVVLVGALAFRRYRDVSALTLFRLWPWVVLGGVAGAHLYWLVAGTDVPLSRRSWTEVTDIAHGSAVQGGFLGGALAAIVFLRSARTPVLAVLDVIAPAGALAQAITRVGCFLAGCCYGRPAPRAFGVVFMDPLSLGPRGVPLYPAQLVESALLVALAFVLYTTLRRGTTRVGDVFWWYVGGYGVIRFLVQFLRGDDADRLVLGLAHSQYAALMMIAVAAVMLRTHSSGSSSADARRPSPARA